MGERNKSKQNRTVNYRRKIGLAVNAVKSVFTYSQSMHVR